MASGRIKKLRLWVVTDRYYPEVISTGGYLTQIAEGLIKEFDVKVISGPPNRSSRGTREPNRELRNGVEIFRVGRPLLDKNVVTLRAVNLLTLGFAMFWRSIRSFGQGDRVLVVAGPLYLPFSTAIASLVWGSSYSLIIYDLYPDRLVARGKLKANSVAVNAINFANSWLFKHAARIIVVDHKTAELVSARTNGLGVPIKKIPYWTENDRGDEPLVAGKQEQTAAGKTYNFGVALQHYLETLR